MSQLATVQESNVVPISGSTMMDVIARAASDPTVDVDKLERLLGMAERVRSEESRQAYATAMNACQAELGRVSADASNPQTKSKYASYPALDRAVRPVYSKHGFSLSFSTTEGAPADYLRLVCHVSHASGHTVDHQVDMPADGKGAKGGDVMTKTHAVGAAMSYGQRYLLKLIFNIAVGEDKDGNAPVQTITQDQVDDLLALMDEVGADRTRFLNFLRVQSLSDLPANRFNQAWSALESKRGK